MKTAIAVWAVGWLISMIVSFSLGYRLNWLYRRLRELEAALKALANKAVTKNVPDSEPKSVLIDPTDIQQRVKYEHDEMMRKLNS